MSIYFIPIVTLLGAALFRYRSIRAFGYGYCPLGNTPSRSPYFALRAQYGLLSPGVALRLPRAVFWRPIRALYFPFPKPHICRRQMSIPPLQTSHLPQADVNSPISKPHICLWQMSIPPLHLWRGGQGVRSIPPLHLWRGGQGVRSMTGA